LNKVLLPISELEPYFNIKMLYNNSDIHALPSLDLLPAMILQKSPIYTAIARYSAGWMPDKQAIQEY